MGGRYDSIDDDFNSENWAFHTMMLVYFFFTVILMLNVLIAVINVAFSVGDGTWRLVWLGNRLRYVESAENLTYHIPGFREAHNWFPDVIYYSATPQQVKAYEDNHLKKNGEDGSISSFGFPKLFGQDTSAREAAAAATAATIASDPSFGVTAQSASLPRNPSSTIRTGNIIKVAPPLNPDRIQMKQQDLLQQMIQNQNEEQREMIKALKQELRDQRQAFEAQMGEMQDQFMALQEHIKTHLITPTSTV
ncbi:hypothetical protein BGZ51_004336 [Haplosporangium sp. Z 767]|nr:hypothetical protein BGZ51_004336 [Haplosporangium sp. Z 767]KAF9186621.1 hypothetical protein BGZ50_002390 [Haplosporangium sp. Z 11]